MDFPQIKSNFDQHFVLPIVRIVERNDAPAPEGRETLKRVFHKRIRPNLVEPETLDMLVTASGGLIGMLIRLELLAAEHALADGEDRLNTDSAEKAIAEVRGDFKALLRPRDYDVLGRCLNGKRLTNESTVQELLYTSALIEYHNHKPWIRVHPMVKPLVQEYGA
ncbi:MAG: hypothetical protein GXP42_05310 [Chloroflexi bacterium]|nr:hypothetical protein [Chloroflexota bacterium]